MKHYLTNTALSNKERCIQAAQRSGMPITFEDQPMPHDTTDPDDEYYHPETMVGEYGCIVLNSVKMRDCTAFWREWEKLERDGV